LADELIGPPAGWGTNTGGSFASIHIHGRYIETLAYNGLAGASALLAWLVVLTRRSRHRARSTSMVQPLPRSSAALLQAILLSELLYFIPYGGGILQSAVLGLLWIAATQGTHLQRVWRFALVPARLLPTAN